MIYRFVSSLSIVILFVSGCSVSEDSQKDESPVFPASGLVAYYPFNGNANDESGFHHNGTVKGATLVKDRFGKANRAYSFGGNPSYLLFGDILDEVFSAPTAKFTVAGWAHPRTTGTASGGGFMIGKSAGGGLGPYQWSVGIVDNFLFGMVFFDTAARNYVSLKTSVAPLHWFHFALVFDGSQQPAERVKLFFNGRSSSVIINTVAGNVGTTTPNSRQNLTMGSGHVANNPTVANNAYNGDLDDIRIYNRALTVPEIEALSLEGGSFQQEEIQNVATHPESLQPTKNRNLLWADEIETVKKMAHQYRVKPKSEGGGGGSYIGFAIPPELATTANGHYWLHDVQSDEIVFLSNPPNSTNNYIFIIDSSGRDKISQELRFSSARREEYNKNHAAIFGDTKAIAKIAVEYRQWPGALNPGKYEGFRIPFPYTVSENASYALTAVGTDTMVLGAVSSMGFAPAYFQIDAKGEVRFLTEGLYRLPKDSSWVKKYRTAVYDDLTNLAAAAAKEFKKRAVARGEGSFTGFSIPAGLDSTGYGKYYVTEIRSDRIIVWVNPVGEVNQYAVVIDAAGAITPARGFGFQLGK